MEAETSIQVQAENSGINKGTYIAAQTGPVINNFGSISPKEASQLAIDLFMDNFPKLQQIARETAECRARELCEQLISDLQERQFAKYEAFTDPDVQFALYEAQKAYARFGTQELEDMLTSTLSERIIQDERNLLQIVLDEAIQTLPMLMPDQVKVMTLTFVLKYSARATVINHTTFAEYLRTCVLPFYDNSKKENSFYQHIEYTKCASISIAKKDLIKTLIGHYEGLFNNGIPSDSPDLIHNSQNLVEKYPLLFTACLNNHTRLQINAISTRYLNEKMMTIQIPDDEQKKLSSLFSSATMSETEVKSKITDLVPEMNSLFDDWDTSQLGRLVLTSVGIAIGAINFKNVTKATNLDLSIWL